jgi:hypothetical protein
VDIHIPHNSARDVSNKANRCAIMAQNGRRPTLAGKI